jgi:uncharacterized protein (DUF1501 family)
VNEQPILIVVTLEGGVDALHLVPPHGDIGYRASRGSLIQPRPGCRNGSIDLDGFFSLNVRLEPLHRLFQQKVLAIVQACGTGDRTLSHFEATTQLNRGGNVSQLSKGWLATHLEQKSEPRSSMLQAVCCSSRLEGPLENASRAAAIPSLSGYGLQLPSHWQAFSSGLRLMFDHESSASGSGEISTLIASGNRTLESLDSLKRSHGLAQWTGFPGDSFGHQLKTVASLIKGDVGLEAAVVSLGGWDSHVNQQKVLELQMQSLASGLSAFYENLRDHFHRIVVITVSEFGRRVAENNGGGTDHGNGTVMFTIGGPVLGGKVYTRWPGISSGDLDENGNLRSTLDYRDVMTEILTKFHGCKDPGSVFPGHEAVSLGMIR